MAKWSMETEDVRGGTQEKTSIIGYRGKFCVCLTTRKHKSGGRVRGSTLTVWREFPGGDDYDEVLAVKGRKDVKALLELFESLTVDALADPPRDVAPFAPFGGSVATLDDA